MVVATNSWLNKIAKEKTRHMAEFFGMEPIHVDVKDPITKKSRPRCQGDHLVYSWDKIYAQDPMMQNMVVETVTGPSTPGVDYVDDPEANPAMPYQQMRALVGDGGKWKWPDIYKQLDLLPRRGKAWRSIDDPSNLGKIENPSPDIVPLNCLVVGGGPVGLRLAIELVLGGHRATVFEKRREVVDKMTGDFYSVGFTNRVNRPHINNFCRNDLDRLNGRNFMTPKMCYPVFTNAHTSSIGIDEAQMLLLKTALLIGVKFQLGVGYVNAEVDIQKEQNQRPSWMVEYTADEQAQTSYNKKAEGTQRFDALFGCDGGQSKVRVTQVDWLGTPKTRMYKKMFGIVSNLRKVSKKKLRELGHSSGLEPDDLSKRDLGIFFYKASFHNYFILHPSAEEMEKAGIPWKGCFGFHKARQPANAEKEKVKANMKIYVTRKAKELGVPIDPTLKNDGFVEAPNDVMGFDFSEFYNCEKSSACMVPPLEWDLDTDGEWEIQCPLVALAGDAVADPNWLLGVGLQRGWNSALDATFYADNIYNNKSFNGKAPDIEAPMTEPVEWSEHLDNLMNLMQANNNNSRDSKLSGEMTTGMLDEKGCVVAQIRRLSGKKDTPVPQYLPPVEPWGRYREYDSLIKNNYKGNLLFKNIHPLSIRELAIMTKLHKFVDEDDALKKRVTRPSPAMLTWPKRFSCSAFWAMNRLLEIDGKNPGGTASIAKEKTAEAAAEPAPKPLARPMFNTSEVSRRALKKKESLRNNLMEAAMAGPSSPAGKSSRKGVDNLFKKRFGGGGGLPAPPPARAALPPPPAPRAAPLPPPPLPTLEPRSAAPLPAAGNASTLKFEKQLVEAKLEYAEREVELLKNLLRSYNLAEASSN